MFSLVSGIYDYAFAPTKLNLLVVGASGTGKTAFLERLKVTQFTKNQKPSLQQQQQQEDVPQSFLPLSLRQAAPKKTKKPKKKKKTKQQQPPAPPPRRGFLACPAPSRYQKHESSDEESDDDEEDEDDNMDDSNASDNDDLPRDSTRSLEDVSLRNDSEHQPQSDMDATTKTGNTSNNTTTNHEQVVDDEGEEEDDEDQQQHDLKNQKVRMLPLHKIRPTIGMNLGKLEMCGAQCNVWDLGGKMHDLWSRYYQDCDAVVFVWKIVDDGKLHTTLEDANGNNANGDDGNDSDSSDDWPPVTAAQQLALLEQVRNSIADDIPFLVLGHWFPPSPTMKKDPAYQYNEAYSTDALLPRYHNPLMSVYFGSAKSGAGVRTALEWLIPVAARQKKFREKEKAAAATAAGDDAKA